MATAKVAITIDNKLLSRVDRLVAESKFPNRSRIIQEAVFEKLERLDHSRLARECAKLKASDEQQLADEGLAEDAKSWPAF